MDSERLPFLVLLLTFTMTFSMDVENHRTRVTVTQDEGEEGEDDPKRTTVVNVNVINVYEGGSCQTTPTCPPTTSPPAPPMCTTTTTTTVSSTTGTTTTTTAVNTTTPPPDPEESIFMVIGGQGSGGQINNVEEIQLNSSQENGCPVPNSFPVTIVVAVGVNMNGTPIVCGGIQNGEYSNQCWTYHLISRAWTNSGQLSTVRAWSAAVYDPQHGFVITGGYEPVAKTLSSAEKTHDGINFDPFPEMPRGLRRHCLVSLKNGNLFATRGSGTFMYHGSNNTWSSLNGMPTMSQPDGQSCGTVERDGLVTDVVAAGGNHNGNGAYIYNIADRTWRAGENLPTSIGYGASVPYQDTFLIVGGHCGYCRPKFLDTVIRYKEDGEWEILPMRLAMGRYGHIVIPKPAC